MSDLKEKLYKHKRKNTKSQNILIKYILNNLEDAAFQNIVELSISSRVSASTITRFSCDLGFAGFTVFQKMLQEELKKRYDNTAKHKYNKVPFNSYREEIENDFKSLNKLKNSVNYDSFTNVEKIISENDKLIVTGFGDCAFIVKRFCYSFKNIKKNIFPFTEFFDLEKQQLSCLHENAVVIMFCFDEECIESKNFYKAAKKYNMKFICISENVLPFCGNDNIEYLFIPTGGLDVFDYGIFFLNSIFKAILKRQNKTLEYNQKMINGMKFINKNNLRFVK